MRRFTVSLRLLIGLAMFPAAAAAQDAPPPAPVEIGPVEQVTAPLPTPPAVPIGTVTFTSAGDPQNVTLLPFGAMMPTMSVPLACRTPCALNVPAGLYNMNASSDGGPRQAHALTVTPRALNVRITPRRSRSLGIGLTAGGGGAAVFGIGFLAVGLEFALFNSSGTLFPVNPVPFLAIGGVAMGVGLALLIPGVMQLRGSSGGVEELHATSRARRPRLLGVGAAPVPGGAVLGLDFAF